MENKVQEALSYFTSEPVFKKLFAAFKKKYESLGKIGGSVSLTSYSEEEIEVLARFLGLRRDVVENKSRVTLLQFEKQLELSRFNGISLKELLEAYFNEVLVSNKSRLEKERIEKVSFFSEMKSNYFVIKEWLKYIEAKPLDSYWIHRLIDKDRNYFIQCLSILNGVVEALPENAIRLPVLAQQHTGNPHAFDRNERVGRLLIHLVAVKHAFLNDEEVTIPNSSEEMSALLLTYNVLRDDITNYVTVANILANTANDKDEAWKAAVETHTVMNVPIRELLDVRSLFPRSFDQKKVYIVENSGIFSSLLDEVPDIPIICTHGQFKLAAWKCLDLFDPSKCTFYYAGDMDPEGIGIANKLLQRYPRNAKLWKMDVKSYENAVSTDEKLSQSRLRQLSGFVHPDLKDLSQKMVEVKSPAYQEALLDEMIDELKNNEVF